MLDHTLFLHKTAKYHTLGCKLNFSETATFAKQLEALGVEAIEGPQPADLCLINTCSVTEVANQKGRQLIKRLVRENPQAFVVVTGCFAQLLPKEVGEIKGVDLVLGNDEKVNLVQLVCEFWAEKLKNDPKRLLTITSSVKKARDITSFTQSCSCGNRTRYFLKVQDGCNYYCTYCTIPFARGFSRNPSIASLVEQAEEVVNAGGKEIVLTGVNIGDFGQSTGESFLDLVKALDKVEGIQRYRISSLEPDLLTDELIAYCAQSRAFMPHFHIPLQSGSDEVLRLMHRRYDTELFAHKIDLIKKYMPDAFIGVDVMVGTRGETEEFFEQSHAFLQSQDVSQLHVFPYSERPGTAALRIPHIVSPAEKKERAQRLLDLSEQKTHAFYAKHIGQERIVLFEKASKGRDMHGFTDNYLRAELPAELAKDEYDNQLVKVRLGGFNADKTALMAELIQIV